MEDLYVDYRAVQAKHISHRAKEQEETQTQRKKGMIHDEHTKNTTKMQREITRKGHGPYTRPFQNNHKRRAQPPTHHIFFLGRYAHARLFLTGQELETKHCLRRRTSQTSPPRAPRSEEQRGGTAQAPREHARSGRPSPCTRLSTHVTQTFADEPTIIITQICR